MKNAMTVASAGTAATTGSHETTENLGFATVVMSSVVAKENPYRVIHNTAVRQLLDLFGTCFGTI